jgi:hypothetical protein
LGDSLGLLFAREKRELVDELLVVGIGRELRA